MLHNKTYIYSISDDEHNMISKKTKSAVNTAALIASRGKDRPVTTHDISTLLGLSISYEIVHRHGGSIRVDSTLGQGTTFILDFPLDI